MNWRLNTPANMAGLKKRLENINKSEKIAVSHILIGVALADGKIDPAEIKQIERLYTSLGLDKSTIPSDIHSLSSARKPSDGIPGTKTTSLDRELLKRFEEETRDVQAVLESIMDETAGEEPDSEKETAIPTPRDKAVPRLDTKYQVLYQKLITREKWSFKEVEKICNDLQLMCDGAIEMINDWAFETVEASLIEDGSTVFYVDLEVAKEIEKLQPQHT